MGNCNMWSILFLESVSHSARPVIVVVTQFSQIKSFSNQDETKQ